MSKRLLAPVILPVFLSLVLGYPISFIYEDLFLEMWSLSKDPEILENATQIIRNYGFHVEEHYVKTADGYILCLIRMRNPNIELNKKVVFLQHGLLDSAHTWINNLRNQSLAFILADAGFDVWLGNSRGSTYSRKHEKYDTHHIEFWEFSWDQMAQFDLPASVYHVLQVTGSNTLGYVGHSQGAQIALAQFNRDPELQSHISLFVALAPVAYLGHIASPIRYIAPFARTVERVWDLFGHGEFLPSTRLLHFLAYFLCGRGHIPFVCTNVVYLLAGYDAKNTNLTRLPVYIAHTPAGTSAKNMVHYCQGITTDQFQAFDYGKVKNLEIYGQKTPPKYDLSKFTVPTAVFTGGNDWLAVEKDVDRLIEQIKPAVVSHINFPEYNHLDFVWGMDAAMVLYPEVLKLLKQY
ncbi:hypothetical protein CRM22_008291 [Opisthorchis felineus]|uniref:Lipase n=1 Tax=Opisthorchis felineus TaxID=147828 RepID=A0A4V3SDI7_OPIFE|nr:hypothetical protein CRM22_008291 [Opisthorchis felineus]